MARKAHTHARIVDTASRLFRRDGYAGTGVDRLMEAVGLTRGGFYAHFRDKAALLSEALDHAFEQSRQNLLEGKLAELSGAEWVQAATERYLDPRHRRHPDSGCAIPALGAEIARAPARVRRRFSVNVVGLVDAMATRLGGTARDRRRALAMLSSWIGALLLSRAVGDAALSDEILRSARELWSDARGGDD